MVLSKICRAILEKPMNRSLKTFLVWLMMAILPLHAMAASVGMSCAPDHRQLSQAPTPGGEHQHHDAAADMHAHHGGVAGHADEVASDADTSQAKAGQQTHSSCSACSALCVGAVAPPSAFVSVPTFDGSDAILVAPPALVPGFIPDGLQRPPRPHSA